MARGESGRIVVEVDRETKRDLYRVLANEECTLKDWFLRMARRYVEERRQPLLFMNSPEHAAGAGGEEIGVARN